MYAVISSRCRLRRPRHHCQFVYFGFVLYFSVFLLFFLLPIINSIRFYTCICFAISDGKSMLSTKFSGDCCRRYILPIYCFCSTFFINSLCSLLKSSCSQSANALMIDCNLRKPINKLSSSLSDKWS